MPDDPLPRDVPDCPDDRCGSLRCGPRRYAQSVDGNLVSGRSCPRTRADAQQSAGVEDGLAARLALDPPFARGQRSRLGAAQHTDTMSGVCLVLG